MKIKVNEKYELLNLSLGGVLNQIELFETLGYKSSKYKGKKKDVILKTTWVRRRIYNISGFRAVVEESIINGIYHKVELIIIRKKLSIIEGILNDLQWEFFSCTPRLDINALINKIRYSIFRLCEILARAEQDSFEPTENL